MKICIREDCIYAGIEQDIENFNKDSRRKNGRRDYCKDCHSVMYKKYYIKNQEEIDAKNKIRAKQQKIKNPEKYAEDRRKYSKKFELTEPRKKYKSHYNRNMKYSSVNNYVKYLWRQAKIRSKEKKMEFNIELSDIIIPIFCPVLGLKLSTNGTGRTISK